MITRVIAAENGVEEGAELILKGETVVFPTETVYGLGADAFNVVAVKKIFEAKGRPQDNPLIVHISSLDEVADIAKRVPDAFYALAERFMPGPLTIILPKSDRIPYEVTAGGETVGVRMPANAVARRLISLSRPLAAPSANRSKHISPTSAQHVYEDLQGRVPLILDGGACRVGIESTVLDLTSECPTILRPGAITSAMLAPILGEVGSSVKSVKIAKAPGMKYQHYSPYKETVTAQSAKSAAAEYDRQIANGKNPVIIAHDGYLDAPVKRNFISLGISEEDSANRIYAALHEAESAYDFIIIEELSGAGIERSVMNRVFKAAGDKRV